VLVWENLSGVWVSAGEEEGRRIEKETRKVRKKLVKTLPPARDGKKKARSELTLGIC